MTCGKLPKSGIDFNRLRALGQALDTGQYLSVFHQGFVTIGDEHESEVIKDVATEPARRSAARAWAGRRTAEGPRRAASQTDHFRSPTLESAFGTEFRILAQHYDALGFEDPDGLWVVTKSKPLGRHGPRIHFLIAFSLDRGIPPRAWAFDRTGPHARLMSLKHTNFPDASICAFLPDENAWSPSDGIIALVDHYSVWAIKKLHRDHLGHWPGKQAGACAYYRRMEFAASEWCGCQSGRKYRDCHQGADLLVNDAAGKKEFEQIFHCDYHARREPPEVLASAKSHWNIMPQLQMALGIGK